MKSKIYKFNPVIYPFPLLVTKDFDKEEIKARYNAMSSNGEEVDISESLEASEDTTARVVNIANKESGSMGYLVLLYRPNDTGAGILGHEALHIANAYLQYLGFSKANAYDDEPYAYFVQWLINCMWSVLIDEPDKMNGVLIQ